MSSLLIETEFITGRCVAADVSEREKPEWPPHPGRLFMAMAGTCFEMDEDPDEVAALEWLECQPPPNVHASNKNDRSRVSVYVPVNDKTTACKSLLQTAPGLSRSKQERFFPTVIPDSPVVSYYWADAEGIESHIKALQRICVNVIRVGHSSSLVRVAARKGELPPDERGWVPADTHSSCVMRIVGKGEFNRLKVTCGADRIDRFAEIAQAIKEGKGKNKKQAKELFEEEFGQSYKSALRPPAPTPPVLGLWQGYTEQSRSDDAQQATRGEHFQSELIVLCKLEGPNLDVEDTVALTNCLRKECMRMCELDPIPEWLSGHDLAGKPSKNPHTAFLTLPFVGSQYADGHVMGLALALPQGVPTHEQGSALRGLLLDDDDESRVIRLKLGKLGEWNVRMELDHSGRTNLQNSTWVGPSRTWASATPVVLDRYPKPSRSNARSQWHAEVVQTIAESCKRAGLPIPVEVDIDTTSWLTGVPRAIVKQRRLRSRDQGDATAPLGGGFPSITAGNQKPPRPQVHVHLTFEQPVHGPVIIGTGRFRGYGLCRPFEGKKPVKRRG